MRDGQIVPAEVLCCTGEIKLENPFNQTPLHHVTLASFGREMEYDSNYQSDQKYIEVFPIASLNLTTGEHIPIGVPPSNSKFFFVEDSQLERYYRSQSTTFKVGYLSGTDVTIGLDIRHFGSGEKGWGDARMMGIAGRTGSGKTVIVGTLIGAYATHPELGILIIDPQGQFSSTDGNGVYVGELGKDPSKWSWQLSQAFTKAGRMNDVYIVNTSEIGFGNDLETFQFLLRKHKFWEAIKGGIKSEKVEIAEERLMHHLKIELSSHQNSLCKMQWNQQLFNTIVDIIASTYSNADKVRDDILAREQGSCPPSEKGEEVWTHVLSYFNPHLRPMSMDKIIHDVLVERRIVILNIDREDDDMKELYYLKLFSSLKLKAQRIYRQALAAGQQSDVNALFVLDEAQRIIPEHPETEMKKKIVGVIRDSINTSRKLGTGWIFATQSVTNIDKGIWGQLGTKFIGYGFGTGADKDRLSEICGKDTSILNRYGRMPMPLQTGKYWFMVQGEMIGIGNGNQCLFIDAFSSQAEIFRHNAHLFPPK